MTIQMIIAAALIIIGLLFMTASLAGIIRLPDFFARLHAQGVGDTLGAFLILAGMMVWTGANLLSVKILLIFIIIVLTNPLGTNLMMIAAINREDYQGYASKMKGEETPDHRSETVPEKEREPEPVSEPETVSEPENVSEPEPESVSEQKTAAEPEPEPITVPQTGKEKTPGKKKKQDPKPDKGKKQGQGTKDPEKKKKPRKRKPSMNMNKAELTSIAEGMGLEIPEGSTKRQILDLIYSSKKN